MLGSRELLKSEINVIEREECPVEYLNHFCAGPSHLGGCEGDDGGAVVCDDVLSGLIGWRYEDYCKDTYNAHLYVNLENFREWTVDFTSSSDRMYSSISFVALAIVSLIWNKVL